MTCPICNSEATIKPRSGILQCPDCGHAFRHPIPDVSDRYKSFDYWKQDREHSGITDIGPGDHWNGYIGGRIGFMEKCGVLHEPPQSILEIGCSEGALLNHLMLLGYDVMGIEVNKEIVRRARETYPKVFIVPTDFMGCDFQELGCDTILSFHTFEHLPDPMAATKKCAELLNPGGHLLIEVPYGPDEYDNPDHLHFFSVESAERMMREHFTNVGTIRNSYRTKAGILMGSVVVCGTNIYSGKAAREHTPLVSPEELFHLYGPIGEAFWEDTPKEVQDWFRMVANKLY
jgi:SAM-dependent methyltransferase